MADEIVEEVVEEVVEESVAEEAKTKIEVNIGFSAEELASLVSSIVDAPTGGYQNVTKNKTVYSLPTKKLAVKVAEKINTAVNEALGAACDKFDAHAETMQGLRDDLTSEADARQKTDGSLDKRLADVETKSRDVAQNLEEEGVARAKQIKSILDRVGVAAKNSTEPGIASLNESGQIPSTQLPSYVDDVIEGVLIDPGSGVLTFYALDDTHPGTTPITPTSGKIYIDINTGLSYRWASTSQKFIPISSPVELGIGVGQAYPGNMGQALADKVLQLASSEYVKFTNYPTGSERDPAGVIRVNNGVQGLQVNPNNGLLLAIQASRKVIDGRYEARYYNEARHQGIPPIELDYAMKIGLTTNIETLSEDSTDESGNTVEGEKAKACKWLGALKAVTSKTNAVRVYVVKTDGSQSTYNLATSPLNANGYTIALYLPETVGDTEAQTWLVSKTPTKPYHTATKKFAEDNFVKKDTVSSNMVYGKRCGNESGYEIFTGIGGSVIPLRTAKGAIRVAINDTEANSEEFAAPRWWVEQHVAAETKNIREALDLAEITETVEVTDKYNFRQAANGLTLYPEQPTTLLKVEGDTIATINKLDLSSVNNSMFEITENGKKITAIASGSYLSSQIGVLQDLCPTIHIGDAVYLYCKDGTSTLPNGLVDANNNVVIPVNTATTITAQMLATTVHLGVYPFMQGFVIEGLQITKVQNAPWTPYFEGLKNAEFAGVESTGKNLFNPNRTERSFGVSSDSIRSFTPNSLYVGVSATNYYSPGQIKSWSYNNGEISVEVNAGGEAYGIAFNFDCRDNERYCVQFNATEGGSCWTGFYNNGELISYAKINNKDYITTPENCNQFVLIFRTDVADKLVHFTNIQVQIGTTATAYVPYIAPTKYAFPNTVNPLGQTIDFENKKIVDYGVEFKFDGTENWQMFNYDRAGNWSMYVAALPEVESDNQNAITTDGFISNKAGASNIGRIQIGHGTQILWWRGAPEYLGLNASWVDKLNPTADERTTAITAFKNYLAARASAGNNFTVRYIPSSFSVQSETPFTAEQTAAGDSYLPYTGGTETVDNANSEWDLENTVTQEYDIVNKIGG